MRGYSGLRRINPKVCAIDIRQIKRDKYPEALTFMTKNFFDDPLLQMMGVTHRCAETKKFLSALWLSILRCGLSLAAVHRNKICGLCINCPHNHSGGEHSDILLRLAKAVKTNSTRNLLLAWDKITRDVVLPLDDRKKHRILELAALAVGYQFRKLGVGQKLLQSSAHYGKLLAFNFARVDCSSPFSAKICDKLGWEKITEIPFSHFDGILNDPDVIRNHKVHIYLQPLSSDIRPT